MLLYVFFRFLHFVAIFGVTAAVIIENLAVKPSISKEDAINLAKISLIDNVSLILTLMAGYTLWFWVGKPSEFYTENPVFLAKLIIFSIILVFGFFPFNFFKRNSVCPCSPNNPIWIFGGGLSIFNLSFCIITFF